MPTRPPPGYTLVELVVVVIILGVLAAVGVPKFVNVSTAARVASIKSLAGVLQSTSENVRVLCKLDPTCDYNSALQFISIGGRSAMLNHGWLDAGDNLNSIQIDAFVSSAGFTASLVPTSSTVFTLDGAPDPPNCAVTYIDANNTGTVNRNIVTTTTGC